MKEVVIDVVNLSKIYKLYDKKSDRFKEAMGFGKKVKYHKHYALKNINFQVKKGETVGIIGTNGSGKSTILKIITGVLNQTEGEIRVNGRISALLELGAGFNMEYTGIENIYLNGTMIGFSKEEIDQRLDAILEFADIGDFVNQPVKTYSSGMFVRLAFAVAINIEPEILIVDEALSVGDVFFQSKCYHKFEEFKEAGKTILFVSHDMGSIAKYCDRVILLNKGNKVAEGESKEIIDIYKKILVNQFDDSDEECVDPKNSQEKNNKLSQKEWKKELMSNPNVIEYGSKIAEIVDYAIVDENQLITNNVEKETMFEIKMRVRFNKNIEHPIFAYTIKDLKGTEITGTNTLFEDIKMKAYKEGDMAEVTFKQKMNLQGGQYLISLGCTGYEGMEFVVFHRLYDVCNLTVISDKNVVGYFDMNTEIVVK